MAAARNERRLLAVACRPMLGSFPAPECLGKRFWTPLLFRPLASWWILSPVCSVDVNLISPSFAPYCERLRSPGIAGLLPSEQLHLFAPTPRLLSDALPRPYPAMYQSTPEPRPYHLSDPT